MGWNVLGDHGRSWERARGGGKGVGVVGEVGSGRVSPDTGIPCRILLMYFTYVFYLCFTFFLLMFGFQSVNITQNPQSVLGIFQVNFD